jgi:hypothetical protein
MSKKSPKVRIRRTQKELFLDALELLSNGEQKLIPNAQLRDQLNWSNDKYARIKQQVDDEKKIIIGRGKGGSVGLATTPGAKSLRLFVSYCHADETLKNELVRHLTPLKHLGLIEVWHDRKIPAGGEWDQIISENLEGADIILLLVSIDFINSKYCNDIELERAIERHEEKSAVVIPVILRSCMWQHTSFSKLQAIPRDGKPVCSHQEKDEAFTEICTSIKLIAEQVLGSK